MRILIVDDEPLARARLRAQVVDNGLGEIVAEADNGLEAVRFAQSVQPDVVLLDIRMPGMDGLEAAQHLTRLSTPPAVIFTTAYDEHALAAFDANAIDYLLKPIRANRLRQALEKALRLKATQMNGLEELSSTTGRSHISGVVKGDLLLVPVERVLYFQADKGYVDVVWEEGTMLIEESLRSLENEFGERFIRVHRNSLIALTRITGLARDDAGNYLISLDGSAMKLSVSRRLVAQVRNRIR
jgi:two-component system response regulator AlgR